MEYRRLGKSGLQLSELSLGSWLTFGKQIKNNIAEDLMKFAYDNGVNFFDNAEIYARGESEIVMGKILNKMKWDRDSYVVSSKVMFGTRGADSKPTQKGLHRKHIVEACEQAMKRLQVDYLDLYFCHRPDKNTPIEETVWSMHNLITQGKILYWGTSEWSAQEIMEAHMFARQYNLIGPTMEQPQYNMLHREKVELEFSQIYKTVGLGTTIWSPLASGVLTGKYNGKSEPKNTRLSIDGMEWLKENVMTKDNLKRVDNVDKIAKDLGLSLPVLAVAWCLKNPNVSTVMLGASKLNQLEENFNAINAKAKLTSDVMEAIEKALSNTPIKPGF
ncbi:aldo/keto reductase [Vicingus serpentipes]|uniref:Aldo/keto reductase n=1 Tax=Vicingus serpentipes TaxID=1926625 RepID=A0A5C6RZ93_9FLAO|nr:aldo/keto reductase [Vicingus serpentipes]TXB67099.1 aldo/keto reductase [Vicingus serpentipes]